MKFRLSKNPAHLGLGAKVLSEPEFTGMEWYGEYAKRHAEDGREARLVSWFTFSEPWKSWEMHPVGAELVLCVSGELTLIQEKDGKETKLTLEPGEYAINEPGVWHTADVNRETTGVFITAGEGTEIRER